MLGAEVRECSAVDIDEETPAMDVDEVALLSAPSRPLAVEAYSSYDCSSNGCLLRRCRMKFVVELLEYLISSLHMSQSALFLSPLRVNNFQQTLGFRLDMLSTDKYNV